jgi:energy-coupling factor transporter transmembrane protein EcfT
LFVILPAATSLVTPGDPVLLLCKLPSYAAWAPGAVYVTREGLFVAGRFLLRSTACITLSFALVASTGRDELLSGLRSLGVPGIFGMVFSMMQRYLSLVIKAAEELHLAKLSRTIASTPAQEREWVAAGMGSLFRRTHYLSQEVCKAMVSRGFNGRVRPAERPRPAFADFIFAAIALLAAVGLVALDHAVFM